MANFEAVAVSNNFEVNNIPRFKEIMENTVTTSDKVEYTIDEKNNSVCFAYYGSLIGLFENPDGPNDDPDFFDDHYENAFDALVVALQMILADGEHIIIKEAGNEKLRYNIGTATLIRFQYGFGKHSKTSNEERDKTSRPRLRYSRGTGKGVKNNE